MKSFPCSLDAKWEGELYCAIIFAKPLSLLLLHDIASRNGNLGQKHRRKIFAKSYFEKCRCCGKEEEGEEHSLNFGLHFFWEKRVHDIRSHKTSAECRWRYFEGNLIYAPPPSNNGQGSFLPKIKKEKSFCSKKEGKSYAFLLALLSTRTPFLGAEVNAPLFSPSMRAYLKTDAMSKISHTHISDGEK